jgi:hypothetical protein
MKVVGKETSSAETAHAQVCFQNGRFMTNYLLRHQGNSRKGNEGGVHCPVELGRTGTEDKA